MSVEEVAASATVGAVTAVVGGAKAVASLGFTASGIAASSTAASMMSVLGGAATPAGGIVATLQAVGATSSVLVSAPALVAATTTGAVVGAAGYCIYWGLSFFT